MLILCCQLLVSIQNTRLPGNISEEQPEPLARERALRLDLPELGVIDIYGCLSHSLLFRRSLGDFTIGELAGVTLRRYQAEHTWETSLLHETRLTPPNDRVVHFGRLIENAAV